MNCKQTNCLNKTPFINNKRIAMKHTFLIFFVTVVGVAAFMAGGCKKQDLKLTTTNDVNIVGYLEKYPDSFSLWKQILDRTEVSNFLNAFGSYTAFVPTN